MGGNITDNAVDATAPTKVKHIFILFILSNELPRDMTRPRFGINAAMITKLKI
jgi:hypothetical protein